MLGDTGSSPFCSCYGNPFHPGGDCFCHSFSRGYSHGYGRGYRDGLSDGYSRGYRHGRSDQLGAGDLSPSPALPPAYGDHGAKPDENGTGSDSTQDATTLTATAVSPAPTATESSNPFCLSTSKLEDIMVKLDNCLLQKAPEKCVPYLEEIFKCLYAEKKPRRSFGSDN